MRDARTNVYVDGFNLYYGALKGSPHKWLDLQTLSWRMLPPDRHRIQRIRYFTAKVSARPDNLHSPMRQQTYFRALRTLPTVTIHLGHFLTHPTRMRLADPPPPPAAQTARVIKTEEKGSDVNLATYLLADAFRDDAEVFVLVSNDSDLTEPLRVVAHELGKRVGILNPQRPGLRSRALLGCRPAFFKQIRRAALASSQFPDQILDRRGRAIRKPVGW
ncbi:MAG TPA: NYN domain-containing protein [Mycobacteriales bacterium]|nr:NYN domain-containing protein [Mycobacteriales bacterium]